MRLDVKCDGVTRAYESPEPPTTFRIHRYGDARPGQPSVLVGRIRDNPGHTHDRSRVLRLVRGTADVSVPSGLVTSRRNIAHRDY